MYPALFKKPRTNFLSTLVEEEAVREDKKSEAARTKALYRVLQKCQVKIEAPAPVGAKKLG
jgi:hypothetical protein